MGQLLFGAFTGKSQPLGTVVESPGQMTGFRTLQGKTEAKTRPITQMDCKPLVNINRCSAICKIQLFLSSVIGKRTRYLVKEWLVRKVGSEPTKTCAKYYDFSDSRDVEPGSWCKLSCDVYVVFWSYHGLTSRRNMYTCLLDWGIESATMLPISQSTLQH